MARSRTLRSLAALGAAAVLFLAACGDDEEASDDTTADTSADTSSTTEATGGGAENTVTISNFSYSDTPVKAGATITVENADQVPHSITADDDSFDSDRIDGGASGTFTAPSEPGEYTVHCVVHEQMGGTLIVEA